VDEAVNVVFGNRLGNPLAALDVHVGEREVPGPVSPAFPLVLTRSGSLGGIVAADKVIDDIGMPDALLDRLGVAQVVFLAPLSNRFLHFLDHVSLP
jgi:hypothetical protein